MSDVRFASLTTVLLNYNTIYLLYITMSDVRFASCNYLVLMI